MLKNGRYCIYHGKEYKINSDNYNRIYIYTEDKDVVDKSFHICKGGYYKKEIQYGEVDEAYDIIPRVLVGKRRIPIALEKEDKYIIRTSETEDAEIIEKCHLVWKDRGEMDGWISKDEAEIRFFRIDLDYYGDWKKKVERESEGYDKEYEIM